MSFFFGLSLFYCGFDGSIYIYTETQKHKPNHLNQKETNLMFKILIVTALVATFSTAPATGTVEAPVNSLTTPVSAVAGHAGALG